MELVRDAHPDKNCYKGPKEWTQQLYMAYDWLSNNTLAKSSSMIERVPQVNLKEWQKPQSWSRDASA
ncbi:hypothetical protein M011DRAFT_471612 [Sporormia fimetaria CBS 119925]|uniref:J domain-containing protein n=1 Tax=Sporormia fimetaria CBS 119925 TaxID=1340428 RepID=A0A6A6UZU8_9PLEO|nr:hypothetical protein M011DRAFT_471612 [Sporormia fimetaria CBS 119925]